MVLMVLQVKLVNKVFLVWQQILVQQVLQVFLKLVLQVKLVQVEQREPPAPQGLQAPVELLVKQVLLVLLEQVLQDLQAPVDLQAKQVLLVL